MPTLLLHGAVRRWTTRLHRWTGLAIMACMLVASVTGTWLVFRVEMDRLVNPRLRVVTPQATRVPLQSILDEAAWRFPNTQVHTLMLQLRPEDSISAYLDAPDGRRLDADRVFFDPYSGAYLGGTNTSGLVFARENVDSLIDRLHYSLWMNTTGLWLMGIVALVWLATSIIGLVLAWPSAWMRLRRWLSLLSVRVDRGPYQTAYRAHRAIGLWFLPVLLVLAFTSFYQNLPQFVRPVVNAISPLASAPRGTPLPDDAAVVTPDRALELVAAKYPEAWPTSVGINRYQNRYSILFRLPGDFSDTGEQWAFMEMSTGRLVGTKLTATQGAGDAFLTWIFPLHTGTAFGWPGRIVVALAGIGLIGMMAAGLYVWWAKWRMRRRTTRTITAPASSPL